MKFVAKKFCDLTPGQVYEILKCRSLVFMLEQNIRCLDMDDKDYESVHLFLEEEGKILAYLRAFPLSEEGAVKIGRVLTMTRGKGLGRELMEKSIVYLSTALACRRIWVDAQVQAAPFYAKCGFIPQGEVFPEEGIDHVKMKKEIEKKP